MIPALVCIIVRIRGANKTEHTLKGRIYSSAARKNSWKNGWLQTSLDFHVATQMFQNCNVLSLESVVNYTCWNFTVIRTHTSGIRDNNSIFSYTDACNRIMVTHFHIKVKKPINGHTLLKDMKPVIQR